MSDHSSAEGSPSEHGERQAPPAPRRRLAGLAGTLGQQGRRTPSPRAGGVPPSRQQIVNGLDRREVVVGIFLTLLALLLAFSGYHGYQHSSTKSLHSQASTYLVASLFGTALLGFGVLFRRRALLGFACFLVGLEFFNYRFVVGALAYLGAGGWLIFRVTQKQKQDRLARPAAAAASTSARQSKSRPLPGAPKPSKRYTPPRKTATGGRR